MGCWTSGFRAPAIPAAPATQTIAVSAVGLFSIPGLATDAVKAAYTDASQFDRTSPYYDPKAKKTEPRWVNVDVRALRKTKLVPLAELRKHKALAKMTLLRPGNRLSITPVSAAEWKYITDRLI